MARPKARHRADRYGFTECGRVIEGSDLLVQPVDGSGDPTTCGTCIHLLTHWCPDCRDMVLCFREVTRVEPSVVTPHGANVENTRCSKCRRRMGIGETLTEKTIKRNDRRRRREDRKQKQVWLDESTQRIAASAQMDEAERADAGVLLDGCALCGLSRPESEFEYSLPPGWWRGKVPYLKWIYCPDHATLGQELESTLVAGLRKDALDIREQLMERLDHG